MGRINKTKKNLSMNLLFPLISSVLLAGSCGEKTGPDTGSTDKLPDTGITPELIAVDPMQKVLPGDKLTENKESKTAYCAKGEYAFFQTVIRKNGFHSFSAADITFYGPDGATLTGEIGWVGYVGCTNVFYGAGDYLLTSPNGKYPDPVFEEYDTKYTIEDYQPILVSVWVPENAKEGTYVGKLNVDATSFTDGKASIGDSFTLNVYPVTVPEQTLYVSNWVSEHPDQYKYMNLGADVEMFSPQFWRYTEKVAEMAAKHRINVHFIWEPLNFVDFELSDNGKYTFDFSNMAHDIEIFEKAGRIDRLEINRYAYPHSSVGVSMQVLEYDEKGNKIKALCAIDDPRTENFYSQYLPALREFLKERGLLDKCMQHIYDEPTKEQLGAYKKISDMMRKYFPEAKLIDATCNVQMLNGMLDIWVPQVDALKNNYDFLKSRVEQTDEELWFYTCMNPQGNFVNRFIEKPLMETRMTFWINYKYDVTGFLYWSFNDFFFDDVFKETAWLENKSPGGDCYIVYPAYEKLLPSLRLYAQTSGIADFELLKLLSKTNPGKAQEIAGIMVKDFDKYEYDLKVFRKARKDLLDALCGK